MSSSHRESIQLSRNQRIDIRGGAPGKAILQLLQLRADRLKGAVALGSRQTPARTCSYNEEEAIVLFAGSSSVIVRRESASFLFFSPRSWLAMDSADFASIRFGSSRPLKAPRRAVGATWQLCP